MGAINFNSGFTSVPVDEGGNNNSESSMAVRAVSNTSSAMGNCLAQLKQIALTPFGIVAGLTMLTTGMYGLGVATGIATSRNVRSTDEPGELNVTEFRNNLRETLFNYTSTLEAYNASISQEDKDLGIEWMKVMDRATVPFTPKEGCIAARMLNQDGDTHREIQLSPENEYAISFKTNKGKGIEVKLEGDQFIIDSDYISKDVVDSIASGDNTVKLLWETVEGAVDSEDSSKHKSMTQITLADDTDNIATLGGEDVDMEYNTKRHKCYIAVPVFHKDKKLKVTTTFFTTGSSESLIDVSNPKKVSLLKADIPRVTVSHEYSYTIPEGFDKECAGFKFVPDKKAKGQWRGNDAKVDECDNK